MSDLRFENQMKQASDSDGSADRELETVLRNFRQSVHGWSEQELSRSRINSNVAASQKRGLLTGMRSPIAVWAMGCAVAVAAISVPVSRHHQEELAAQRQAAIQLQQQQAEAAAARKLADSISDEELLSHVDSDVAQATPEALEPLASLMSDAKE